MFKRHFSVSVISRIGVVVSLAAALICIPTAGMAAPILAPTLASFAVLGASDVTCVPTCVIGGNVGSFPTAPTSTGADYSFSFGSFQPGLEGLAQIQLTNAINTINAFLLTDTIADGNLDAYQTTNGGFISPGTYDVGAATENLVGIFVLDGGGLNTARWAFRFSSALVTSTVSNVVVQNVGNGAGVGLYWTVATAATINGPTFARNVMAGTSITSDGDLVLSCGRLLAVTGLVSLIHDTISIGCTNEYGGSDGFNERGDVNPGPGPGRLRCPARLNGPARVGVGRDCPARETADRFRSGLAGGFDMSVYVGSGFSRTVLVRLEAAPLTYGGLERNVHADVDLPRADHRRRLSEERRGQRAAVADVVGAVGQVLDLHEQLQPVARGA